MADAIHERLLVDLASFIASLNLTGLAGVVGDIGAQVYAQTLADGSDNLTVTFPNVRVTAEGMEDEEGDSGFEIDEVVYPCLVLICDSAAPSQRQARGVYRRWKHDIARALFGLESSPLLPNCPELFDIRLRSLPSSARAAVAQHKAVEGLVARCYTTEPRDRR